MFHRILPRLILTQPRSYINLRICHCTISRLISAGTFSTDVNNLQTGDMFFKNEAMPAFVHEYCHYIQDITTSKGLPQTIQGDLVATGSFSQ